jgi:hypothetical protein
MRSPGIEPGSITWQATIITTRPRALRQKRAPEVRLELTTYRLTAGRATDCAIQELVNTKMQSVGIEPTLLRTCALSMRLNHSAKTAGWNINIRV